MAAIKLLVELVTGDNHLVRVDDDYIPTHVHGGAITWLVFAPAHMVMLLRYLTSFVRMFGNICNVLLLLLLQLPRSTASAVSTLGTAEGADAAAQLFCASKLLVVCLIWPWHDMQ